MAEPKKYSKWDPVVAPSHTTKKRVSTTPENALDVLGLGSSTLSRDEIPMVFSVDFERNNCVPGNPIDQIGLSAIDVRKLVGNPPGDRGLDWQKHIRSTHFKVTDCRHDVNHPVRHKPWCKPEYLSPDTFFYKKSTDVTSDQVILQLQKYFNNLRRCGQGKGEPDRVLIMIVWASDLEETVLNELGLGWCYSKNGGAKYRWDIQRDSGVRAWQAAQLNTRNKPSLKVMCDAVGLADGAEEKGLFHNAGMDAAFTLQLALALWTLPKESKSDLGVVSLPKLKTPW